MLDSIHHAVQNVFKIVSETLLSTHQPDVIKSTDQTPQVVRSKKSTKKTPSKKRGADSTKPCPSAKKVKFSNDTPDQTDELKEAAYKEVYQERLRQEAAVPSEDDKQIRCSRADTKDESLTPDQQIAHKNMCESLSVDDRIGMELREKFGKWDGPNNFNKEALELDISSCLELLYESKTK